MKKLLFKLIIVLVAFNTGNICGQELAWGKTLTSDTKGYIPNIFGEDKDFIYVISYERGNIAIEKFDKKKWEKSYSKEIEAKSKEYIDNEGVYDKSTKILEQITLLSDKFLVFSSGFNNETNVYSLYTSIYDAKTGEKTQENKKLHEVKVENVRRKGKWGFVLSKNRSYVLIHHFAYHKKKRMYETHNIIIDENIEILVDKKETETRDENTYRTYNYMVDNEGSFYYAKRCNAAETYVVSYDANKDYEKWEEKIDLENLKSTHRLSTITFGFNEKNDIIITGFYEFLNEKARKDSFWPGDLKGCFFMKIDGRSKELIVNKITEFSEEFVKSFQTRAQKAKNEMPTILNHYEKTSLFAKTNGGCVFIGENYTASMYGNIHEFFFNDLIVINLAPSGEIIWVKNINKHQVYKTYRLNAKYLGYGQYFSYAAGLCKDKLVVLYNAHPNNVGLPISEPCDIMMFKQGVPVMASIDLANGDIKYEKMKGLKEERIHFIPMKYYHVNQASDMILFGREKKNYKFGVLSF